MLLLRLLPACPRRQLRLPRLLRPGASVRPGPCGSGGAGGSGSATLPSAPSSAPLSARYSPSCGAAVVSRGAERCSAAASSRTRTRRIRTMRAPGSPNPPNAAAASMFPPPRQRPLPAGGGFRVRMSGAGGDTAPPAPAAPASAAGAPWSLPAAVLSPCLPQSPVNPPRTPF